jgi:hypothetical protein
MKTPAFVQTLKKDIPARTPTPLKNRAPEGAILATAVIAQPVRALLMRRTLPILVTVPFLIMIAIPFDVMWKQTTVALALYFAAVAVIAHIRFNNRRREPRIFDIYDNGIWFPQYKLFIPANRLLEGFMPRENKKSPGTGSFFISFFAPGDIIGSMNRVWQKKRWSFACPGFTVFEHDKAANTAIMAMVVPFNDYDGLNVTIPELTAQIESLIAAQNSPPPSPKDA